jgi:hypothetical protein
MMLCLRKLRKHDFSTALSESVYVLAELPQNLSAHVDGPGLCRFIQGNTPSTLVQNVIQVQLHSRDGRAQYVRTTDIELRLADCTAVHARVTRARCAKHPNCINEDTMCDTPCVITFQSELRALKMWIYAFGARVEPCISTRTAFDLFAPSRVLFTHTFEAASTMYEPCVNSDHTLLAYIEYNTLWLHELPSCRVRHRFTSRETYWEREADVPAQRLIEIKGHLQGLCFTPEHTLLVSTPGHIYEITTDGRIVQAMRGAVVNVHGITIETHNRLCIGIDHSDFIAASGFYGGFTFARKSRLQQ